MPDIRFALRNGARLDGAIFWHHEWMAVAVSLLVLSVPAHAGHVPAAIIDSCLLFDRPSDASISITQIEGEADLLDDVTVPGYQLFNPGGANNKHTIGYATSKRGSNDFIFVGVRRGYIRRAVALGKHRPSRVEQPVLAGYALLRQHGRRYVCVMESNGSGSAAFVRSAYVGRIPSSELATLQLYYKMTNVKEFKPVETK
ncbi:hypothetical protein MKD38_14350 [Cupriavidus sp. WGlv3]|uniref:hypothetical protein n=1 Tax=Cupriavidus sp. WGlv3 TaxID=2919924 RepID=UPI0020913E78|nr:hypothetical protein [Cupriavidus sp. WGlv3]MCO4862865.1 hypothetical protein [Cupriavidus sp. WGlv3]